MTWLFCNALADPLLEPLEVLVEEPLLLQYHIAGISYSIFDSPRFSYPRIDHYKGSLSVSHYKYPNRCIVVCSSLKVEIGEVSLALIRAAENF